jgi:hypothetical protein
MLGFLKRLLGGARNDVYGLDHAVLNVQLPPQTMWMNMGYWEVGFSYGKIFTQLTYSSQQQISQKPAKPC